MADRTRRVRPVSLRAQRSRRRKGSLGSAGLIRTRTSTQ
jgi:hypothetical protein